MYRRTRWTPMEIEKLQQIYEEELAKGSKRLWVRITERVNKTVRIAKRQAIEYKWKNFCRTSPNNVKLCENQRLIELLLTLISDHGYKELAILQQFKGITESNLKNIFYSNVRSMSNYLRLHVGVKESVNEIVAMLKNRKFLLDLKEQSISLLEFRRKINFMKKYIMDCKKQRNVNLDEIVAEQKFGIINDYDQIRRLYLSKDRLNQKASKTTIQHESIQIITSSNYMRPNGTSPCYYNYPTSMQLLQNIPLPQKNQTIQEELKRGSEFSLGDWQHQIYFSKLNDTKASYEWLCNDF